MTRDEKIQLIRECLAEQEFYDRVRKELLDFIDELTSPNCKSCSRNEPYTHLTMRNE